MGTFALKRPHVMLIAQITNQMSPVIPTGIGLGSVIAALCSWERNRSIIWAIVAAFLSWIYVIYFAVTRPNALIRNSRFHRRTSN